ncbi:MAG: CoA transferase [Deltaproteobacteria bacterium]|jgi:formyl-CoA transferase|nr:CoA transferase [Deltaproteobacteria bacterium]MBW2498241.1 CoA transferase [Deltaproteobacteria bacterium]
MSDLPLKGLKILAPEQMMALPHATQLLALLGAEVLKVEPLGGESGRHGRPMVGEHDGSETGSTFVRNNLAKESIAIDLKSERGRDLFLDLAARVDAVVENFRPGTVDKLGIGYDAVRARNPEVIYLSISGFGNRTNPPSPYRERAAYAPIVEAMAGLYEYARDGDDPPRLASAGAIGDTGPGLYAVIGLLSALHQRERTGRGCHVDVSMYDAMIAIADVVHIASVGVIPSLATRGIGIFDSFRANDGWFAVEIVREPHFPRFCDAVGHPEWKEDPRLATRSGWAEHLESVIRPAVEEWARGRGKAEAAAELARHGVAAGPVNTAADIVDDPHVRSRGLVHDFEDPTREEPVHVVGSPLYFGPRGEQIEPTPKRWPRVGEQTERVLESWLGLSPETIETFRKEGVVR